MSLPLRFRTIFLNRLNPKKIFRGVGGDVISKPFFSYLHISLWKLNTLSLLTLQVAYSFRVVETNSSSLKKSVCRNTYLSVDSK